MKNKLPNIYKGKNNHPSKNQKQSMFNLEDTIKQEEEVKPIGKQIKDIFSSPNFVYKADVSIIMNDGETLKKTIIGRTNNSLITMDDELIDVSKINKIDFIN